MGKVLDMVIKFVKYFICKWFATRVIERIVILLLEELVKRTDSVPRTLRGLFIFCATLTLYGDYPSPNHIQTLTSIPTSYQPF